MNKIKIPHLVIKKSKPEKIKQKTQNDNKNCKLVF